VNTVAWSLGGAVLAGGESRRMGRDKARLDWEGAPLWRRQLNVLRRAGADPVFVVRRNGQPRLGERVRQRHDTVEGAGPLAGLHAALLALPTRWLAVLAVDMPQIDADWFCWLGQFCRPGTGAVARTSSGFEPLAAIFPREAAVLAAAHLQRGDRSLQHLVAALVQMRRLIAVPLPASGSGRVLNWNTPTDADLTAPPIQVSAVCGRALTA